MKRKKERREGRRKKKRVDMSLLYIHGLDSPLIVRTIVSQSYSNVGNEKLQKQSFQKNSS